MSIVFTLKSETSAISVTGVLWAFSTWTEDHRVPEGLSSFLGVAKTMEAVRGRVGVAQSSQSVFFVEENDTHIYACLCTPGIEEAEAFGHIQHCIDNTPRKIGGRLKETVQRSARHFENAATRRTLQAKVETARGAPLDDVFEMEERNVSAMTPSFYMGEIEEEARLFAEEHKKVERRRGRGLCYCMVYGCLCLVLMLIMMLMCMAFLAVLALETEMHGKSFW